MLDPRMFRSAGVLAGCVGILTAFAASFGLFYVNASVLQYVHGFSVLQAGWGILPMIAPIIVLAPLADRIAQRVGVPLVLAVSFATLSGGMCLLAVNVANHYGFYALSLFLIGTGVAPIAPVLTVEMTSGLPVNMAGVGGGVQSATRELGSALGVAIVGTIVSAIFSSELGIGGVSTVAEALGRADGNRASVVTAFASAASTGILTVGIFLAITGVYVVYLAGKSRRPA